MPVHLANLPLSSLFARQPPTRKIIKTRTAWLTSTASLASCALRKAPARDANLVNTADAEVGADIFNRIGCATRHAQNIGTAPAGSVINGGSLMVPDALGNKIIRPYSNFLLHNVVTGDGIVQNGGPATAYKLRTPPLWGARLRSRLLLDGRALTFAEAIRAHDNEASHAARGFFNPSDQEKQQLLFCLSFQGAVPSCPTGGQKR